MSAAAALSAAKSPMALPITLMGGGTALNAAGQYSSGQAAAAAGVAQQQGMNYQAAELRNQANSVMGAASRQAADQATNTNLVLSSIRAREAGNVGASTISSTELASTVAGRGEYNLLTDVANGQNKAAGLNAQAALDTFQGTQAYQAGLAKRQAGETGAIGTVMTGAGSLYARFGAGGWQNHQYQDGDGFGNDA